MMKKEILEKLTGRYGEGRSFRTSTKWVEENDPEIYECLHDLMAEFVQDETNATDENDLTDFETWIVEYTFNKYDEEIEMLVTAGRDIQHIANQAAWIKEIYSVDEVIDFLNWKAYLEQLD